MAARARSTLAAAIHSLVVAFAPDAAAQDAPPDAATALPVAFAADQVRLDTRTQALDVSGHVRVEEPPFFLTSDALRLKRVPIGVELDGRGRLAFCACLGTPLAVRFSGATVAPPHDVILKDPVLEVFGVPVAWAPAFWLRSPGRVGVLPPDLAWRGQDGFFAGGGIHVPWRNSDATRGIDLHGGGYVEGGFLAGATLRTAEGVTDVRWDRLRGADGVGLEARGSTAVASERGSPSVAWDVTALRGVRAVQATTDVDPASMPFDRADAQASWMGGGWTVASGVRAAALRGGDLGDLGSGGPIVVARRSDAIASAGAYAATIEGGQVSGGAFGPTSFVRAETDFLFATRLGIVGTALELDGLGDVADDGSQDGADGAAQIRGTVALPLVRAYASQEDSDPWVHRTEPRLEAAATASHADAVLVQPAGRGAEMPNGRGWIVAGGWENTMGRWGSRSGGDLDLSGGAVGGMASAALALRGRGSATVAWGALSVDYARIAADAGQSAGEALFARARFGSAVGMHAAMHVAERDGVDPVLARMLVSAPLEPASGFLLQPGWTGGARVSVPIGPRVTARGGGEFDLDAQTLLAAVGSVELHDRCDCVVVRASAAHRVGREGVDVWVSVDVPSR